MTLLDVPRPHAASGAPAAAALSPQVRVLLRALVGLRWAGLAVAAIAVGYDHSHLQRGALAALTLALMGAVTAAVTVLFRRQPSVLLDPSFVILELVAAVGVQIADGWVFGSVHVYDAKSLGAVWIFAAVLSAGIALGPALGAGAGGLVALCRLVGATAPTVHYGPFLYAPNRQPRLLATVTAMALATIAGWGGGWIARTLRGAQDEIADLHARERLANTLHDSTLQSLAYISRRAADPDIARVARDADAELRGFLHTGPQHESATLAHALGTVADRARARTDAHVRVAIDAELPDRPADVTAAVTGAVTEAFANAAKHAHAAHVTLYAASDDTGIRVSVIDDGAGFDPNATAAGGGLDQSIRARIRRVGGTVSITSRPGEGTEVELWIP